MTNFITHIMKKYALNGTRFYITRIPFWLLPKPQQKQASTSKESTYPLQSLDDQYTGRTSGSLASARAQEASPKHVSAIHETKKEIRSRLFKPPLSCRMSSIQCSKVFTFRCSWCIFRLDDESSSILRATSDSNIISSPWYCTSKCTLSRNTHSELFTTLSIKITQKGDKKRKKTTASFISIIAPTS